MKKNGKLLYLVITAAIGAFFWILGELLFNLFTEKLFTPLGIALYFLLFGVIITIALFIISASQNDLSDKNTLRNIKDSYRIVAICLVVLFGVTMLFEFLYELGSSTAPNPTSYIFLIDDSGSMQDNDPENLRANAIKDIMSDDKSMPYSVYKFTDTASLLKKTSKYSPDDINNLKFDSYGGTSILNSIKQVLEDIKNNNYSEVGKYPRIVLLSDGASRSFGMRLVTKNCLKSGITICSVGFGNCDEEFLQKIANQTGGAYVYCNQANQLAQSMKQAISKDLDRNLLSSRFVYKNNSLYAFLRILFLTIMSIIWCSIKMLASYDETSKGSSKFLLSFVCCFVGTVIIEFLSSTIISIRLIRLLFCLLWSVYFGNLKIDKPNSKTNPTDLGYEQPVDPVTNPFGPKSNLKSSDKSNNTFSNISNESTSKSQFDNNTFVVNVNSKNSHFGDSTNNSGTNSTAFGNLNKK
ncbi:MAG: VWA domain-containing protein [Faecalibacterium sp.]|nr:VWA domain-containing protein [Ruminococcus sp.]MCM1391351.1 VWA domain-containing protein [Ruminococcus sp.]MCM1484910.1 VWA domain-containing protein [Faecalibacterium sp.]